MTTFSAFSIGKVPIGGDAPVFIVAELSANHGSRKDIAFATIEAAAKAGANAIKLQTYTPDTLTLRSDAEPFVVKTKNEWAGRTLYDLYQEAMTPWEWHAEAKACAESVGLELFSTPFDATAVEYLEHLHVPAHKIASFELNDLVLVERVARTGKPVIMSTGMASLADIEAAVSTCRAAGNDHLVLLRCVSSYPARPECMDLASFDVLRAFGTVVGLSDHTRDATVAIASTALGAKVIEKHLILDRKIGGPDAFFSLEPDELRSMISAVRDAEKAIGRPRFGPSADEIASTAFRRSLFVARDVRAGEVLTCDDVRSVRPSHGLPPKYLPAVLGRAASRDLMRAMPLTWDMVAPATSVRVQLRRATSDDAEHLLSWRNDAETRAMSLSTEAVSREQHLAWLTSALESATRTIFVAEDEGDAVGSIRLDRIANGSMEVSITVAPPHRGKAYAVEMLRAVERAARQQGAKRLVATIKKTNVRSSRVFKVAGYYGFVEATPELLMCERRLVDY